MYGFVRDILEEKGTGVATVKPGATVRGAVREMNEQGIGSLLVVDAGRPVGIFTERDVLRRVVDDGRDPEATRVGDIMTRDLVTIGPEATVEAAMATITEHRCRHLPVVEDGTLRGLVSIGDVMRHVSMSQAHEIQHLVDYIQTGRAPAG